jgi:AcrR family transcriptional regulator
MATDAPSKAEPAVDGRRARRERGRAAVIDAMLALVFEGHVPPTVEQVAERAGVSTASIFRYFDTLEDLRHATSDVYFERHAHLFDIPGVGDGSLADRIDRFVASRVALYQANEPMARLVRLRSYEHAGADEMLRRLRATRADQVRHHFHDELRELSAARRDDLVTIISTLTSFESWEQARYDHHRSSSQLRRAWAETLSRLIET